MKDIRCDLCGKAVDTVYTLRKQTAIEGVKDLCWPCESSLSKYRYKVAQRLEQFTDLFVRKRLRHLYENRRRGSDHE